MSIPSLTITSIMALATLGLSFSACEREDNPLDTHPFAPRNFKIAINGDSAATRDTSLRVAISGENIAFMQLDLDSMLRTSPWETFATLKILSIPRVEGEYWVYARFASASGDTTDIVQDGIRLDLTAYINMARAFAASDTLEPGSTIGLEMETGEAGIAEVSLGTYITRYRLIPIHEGFYQRDLTIPFGIQENSAEVFGYFTDYLGNPAEPFRVDRVFVIQGPQLGPIIVGRLTIPNASGSDIWFHRGFCFMSDLWRQVQVIDAHNPRLPTLHHIILTADWSQGLSGNSDLLALADCHSGITIISLNPPISSAVIGHSPLPGLSKDVVLWDNWAFLASYSDGLIVVDLSDPGHPHYVTSLATFCHGESICLNDTVTYISGAGGMAAISVKHPREPNLLSELVIDSQPKTAVFYENRLFVATRMEGVAVVDVSDPWNPSFIPTVNQLDSVLAMSVAPPYLISSRNNTLCFANMTDPYNLPVIVSLSSLNCPRGMFVQERWLYVAGEEEFTVVDLFPEE